MHRFFVPPEAVSKGQVVFDAPFAHQMRHVLRMRGGEQVIVLDNSGWEYQVELTNLERDRATGQILERRKTLTEPTLSLTLYQSLIKRERFEWILQKGTELGVSRFVPLFTQHTISNNAARVTKKQSRWERIIREAAEQSHRGRLSKLGTPLTFEKACQESLRAHDVALILWADATERGLNSALRQLVTLPKRVALLIGPEGGFARSEAVLAQEQGIQAVTLGPRILRAETAGIAAAAIVMAELGEME